MTTREAAVPDDILSAADGPPSIEPRSELEPRAASAGAWQLLRAAFTVMPELRTGIGFTLALAVVSAAGRLATPVLVQQVLDRSRLPDGTLDTELVGRASAVALVVIVAVALAGRAAYRRLVRATQDALYGLRVTTFEHLHRLSIAELDESRRGAIVARVTSDVETLAQFAQWGLVSWFIDPVLIVATVVVMAVYSWQLALVVMAVYAPLPFLFVVVQRRQLAAYDRHRARISETLTELSEAVTGAPVVRAYGAERVLHARLERTVVRLREAQIQTARWFAVMLPLGDLFGAAALVAVVTSAVWYGEAWGLGLGAVVAFLFLVNLVLQPVGDLGEVIDHTQTAVAGFRKILTVLQLPVDVVEPDDGRALPPGPLGIHLDGVSFSYRSGPRVLHDLHLVVPAGAHVAVVGATGSGKTTLAKLLARLADPDAGRVVVGGLDLRHAAPDARRQAIRMVPQDGFLFDAPVGANVAFGRPGATVDDVRAAFTALGLSWWVDRLSAGLETPVGERGEQLSVGERQLVALARAGLADPGLLILDEATSAVDPETDVALAGALDRLSSGRTTVTVAHRLATAERADLVVVFDRGRIVESGRHHDLVAAGGTYARLHTSWLGATAAS